MILSKLDNVDEAKRNRYRAVYSRLYEFRTVYALPGSGYVSFPEIR